MLTKESGLYLISFFDFSQLNFIVEVKASSFRGIINGVRFLSHSGECLVTTNWDSVPHTE